MSFYIPKTLQQSGHSILNLFRLMVAGMSLFIGQESVVRAESPDTSALEYEVKAAFLVKFGRFVEWSTNAPVAGDKRGFTIGILGKDPFGKFFDDAVKREKIGEHPVHILRAREPRELLGCQIVFICASESERLVELIRELSGKGILTVADDPEFTSRGGMIGFVKEAGKVRFEINPVAAEQSGMKISSKLLQVSRRVTGGESVQ